LANVAVSYKEFQELNTEVLSINTDSVYTHKVWNDIELSKMISGGMPYPMVTDATGSIAKLYGVYDNQTGTTLRGTFIIDSEGYIHGMEVLTSPVGRSTSEIIRRLKAYQTYVSTQKLIPADWNPGDKTLTESVELAGRVWTEWKPMQVN
jgi:alkyl hydroperoxide reductase subunit AhpC